MLKSKNNPSKIKNDIKELVVSFSDSLISLFVPESNAIPPVKTVSLLGKLIKDICHQHELNKLEIFINEINENKIDKEVVVKHLNDIKNDNEKFTNEIEYLIVLISKYVEFEKVRMLKKIYIAYLKHEINWEQFKKCSCILDQLIIGDYKFITENRGLQYYTSCIPDEILRLVSLGILSEFPKDIMADSTIHKITIPAQKLKDYKITEFGEMFIKIIEEKN